MSAKPLLGTGVLAIWNGMEPGFDDAFMRWHVGEHIPERLAVPGFLRARRYRAVAAEPRYFNFYEVERPEVLESVVYLARLNDPSPRTQQVVPHFTDMSRTLCHVAVSHGHGVAGFVWAIRFGAPARQRPALLDRLLGSDDVSAVHLLERYGAPPAGTKETAMRSAPDQSSPAILLVEGAEPEALTKAVTTYASDAAILDVCGTPPTHRGFYQLDFLMDRATAKADA